MPKYLNKTKISWCDYTWNPITGCTKISTGCDNCYAHALAKRFGWSMDIQLHPERLDAPSKLKKPSKIFVCSMGDLFHEDVLNADLFSISEEMFKDRHHDFLLLTKRPELVPEWFFIDGQFPNYENGDPSSWRKPIWLGVTVENRATKHRIDTLRKISAAKRFISFEPLLEDVGDLDLEGIDWVIVGGETGPGARVMELDWVGHIRFQCYKSNTPFFFKQWGAVHDKKHNENWNRRHVLSGKVHHNWPV